MSMENRHDDHALRLDQVDETVGTHQELAITGELWVSQPVTAVGEPDQGLRGVYCQLSKVGSVGGGVPGDEADRLL
jgi:hypothetical protein